MKSKNVRQIVLPLITAFIWGSSFVSQSLGAGHLGFFSFNALRAVPAALSLALLLAVMQRIRPRGKYSAEEKRALLRGGLVCGLFLTLGTNLQQLGLESTSAGKAGFITALYIVLVPVFSIFLGKKTRKIIWLCVAIAVAGLYFLCFDGGAGEMAFNRGDLFVFLCAFAFTGQMLSVDHYVKSVDGVALSCVQFIVVAVLSGLGALVIGEQTTLSAVTACLPHLLYVGILSSGVGYTLQILAQKDGDPTVVSLLLSLESFFAVVSGAIILHERMSGREYFGCALMLAAVILSQLPEKSAKAVESSEKA